MRIRNLIQRRANGKAGRICVVVMGMACVSLPRVWNIGHPSFTYDELYDYRASVRFADHPSLFSPISEGYLNGQLPFFSVFPLYRLFGRTESVARLLSVWISLASILCVFLIVKRLHGFWFGVLAILFLGFCPFFLSASRLAFTHGHIFCTLPLLGSLCFLQRLHGQIAANNTPDTNRWLAVGVGICMGIAVGSDLMACFWLLSILCVMHIWIFRSSAQAAIGYIELSAISCVIGIMVASPMYICGFPTCIKDILNSLKSADGQTGYLWFGHVVDRLPIHYYAVVLATKLSPVILLLAAVTIMWHIRRSSRMTPFVRILAFFLWPVAYLSVKPWKSPYYLIPFMPLLYILLVDGLHTLWTTAFKTRTYLGYAMVLLIIGSQLYAVVALHPDYLMHGIQYSTGLYGEFQGPAVSHGQWIGEAFRYIKQDCRGRRGIVYAVSNVGTPQIRHYSEVYDVTTLVGELPPREPESDAACDIYVLISRDAKQMNCPAHRDAVRDNRDLVSFAETSREYTLVQTYSSGSFPMIWIYKRSPSQVAPAVPSGNGVPTPIGSTLGSRAKGVSHSSSFKRSLFR